MWPLSKRLIDLSFKWVVTLHQNGWWLFIQNGPLTLHQTGCFQITLFIKSPRNLVYVSKIHLLYHVYPLIYRTMRGFKSLSNCLLKLLIFRISGYISVFFFLWRALSIYLLLLISVLVLLELVLNMTLRHSCYSKLFINVRLTILKMRS